jgi:hypothetical protein
MPTVATAQVAPPDPVTKAKPTYAKPKLKLLSARNSARARHGNVAPQIILKGHALPAGTNYQWLITLDDVGNPSQPLSQCQNTDPNYPVGCQWPSVRQTAGNIHVIAQGDQTKDPFAGLPQGKYLISVLADGYTLGGSHFSIPGTTPAVDVNLIPNPVPLGTMRLRVYHDNAPVDATYEADAETGGQGGQQSLAGFEAHLTDVLGLVTTDWFGNPLCTNYQKDSAGKVVFDSTGSPIIDAANPGGHCYSDAGGDIVIPNLGSNRYGVTVSKPANKADWVQTTTLEGAHDHDVWLSANDTGLDTELILNGEPVPWVEFGFIDQKSLPAAPSVDNQLGSVRGQILAGLAYVGGQGGLAMPGGTGTVGGKEGPPIDRPWISLSDLNNGDQMVYTGRGNADGTFNIPNVPPSSYQVTAWDDNQDYIIFSFNVVVRPGEDLDTGKNYLSGWMTRIYGTVFIDTNGNGRRDPGEVGVPGTTLTLRERDNSLIDQMQGSANTNDSGEYSFTEAYPLTKWLILEHFNTRYETTGVTYQGENDPHPTTLTGAGVDINVLPVLGLGGRVDWGVKPYAPGTNGGIVGTVTYDSTRNELDPAYSVTEVYQPGIPGVPVNLYGVLRDTDPNSATYGQPILDSRGLPQRGPKLAATYSSEEWHAPKGCTARQWDGTPLTPATFGWMPTPGLAANQTCVESPAMGFQANFEDNSTGAFSQRVNGNYGFSTSDLNLYPVGDPNNPGLPGHAGAHDLPLYADLAANGYEPQALAPEDYIVAVDIPDNPVGGGKMYQVTKEQDVNIFTGDTYLPQENYPVTPDATTNPPIQLGNGNKPEAPPSQGGGLGISPCVGGNNHVTVTNPDFIAGGGSPYEGMDRPLCDEKLVTVRAQQAVAPNFNLFTPVPLPTHFYGLTINDLGMTTDTKSVQYGEAQGLPNIPMGIYDWSGQLIDTVSTDYNGWYEAIEPSTSAYNCPLPAGPCPNIYRFVGNDPGQPGAANANFNPRYRTISANFQAWPGLFTVTDTAPSQTAAVIVAPGTTTAVPVDCTNSAVTPEVWAVDKVVVPDSGTVGERTVTVTGNGFGIDPNSPPTVQLLKQDGTPAPATAITSWSNTQITFVVPSSATAPASANGPVQLRIRNTASGLWTSSAVTIQEVGSRYNPYILNVGDTTSADFSTIQGAINAPTPAALVNQELTYGRVIVVHPQLGTTFNPMGAYFENPILNKRAKLQGFGPGGTRADGTVVPGSVIDGSGFNADGASGTAWVAIANGPHAGPTGVPDGAVVTVEPRTSSQFALFTQARRNQPPIGSNLDFAAVDGFRITGGYQQDVAGNLNVITGGNQSGFGAAGAAITQGGGIYVHASADNLRLTNNLVIGNSGSFAGGIRVGTPYESNAVATNPRTINQNNNNNNNLQISYNRIRDNGGTNLAGGVGLFVGTANYKFDHNDVCGNFSSEYGGGLSVFGRSTGGTVSDNRIWFNESYDEGGGVFFAGQLTANPNDLSTGTGPQTITRNVIMANTANDDGGGLRLLMVNNDLYTVTNNMIVDNMSTHEGGGIALDDATNVRIVNDTVARNITTATAVTSTGAPAAAGLSTGANSVALQASLPPSAPKFSNPVLLNDVFWQNKAGWFDGTSVQGVGADGTTTIENYWDIGSLDSTEILSPVNSILTTPNPGQLTQPTTGKAVPGADVLAGAAAALTPYFDVISSADNLFTNPFKVSVSIATLRTFPGFRQSVIVVNNVSPDLLGDYHLKAGTNPAVGAGIASRIFGAPWNTTVVAPTVDIDGANRIAHVDAGADQR